MSGKPTYEELEQKIKSLEKDAIRLKSLEKALHELTLKHQALFDHAGDGISVYEQVPGAAKRSLIACNERYAQFAGRSKQELISIPDIRKIQQNYHSREVVKAIQKKIEAGESVRGIFSWDRPDGRENYIEYRAVPIRTGDRILIYGVDRDITEWHCLVEKMRKYEFIVDAPNVFMSLINREYRYEAINERFCRAHGKRRKEILGRTIEDLWDNEMAKTFIKPNLDKCFGGDRTNYQRYFEFGKKEKRYYDVSYHPYYDDKGDITHCAVVTQDITEQKRTEGQVEQLNRLKEQLLVPGTLEEKLKLITDKVVSIFNADLSRIWIIKPGDRCDSGCYHAGFRSGQHACRQPDRCLHLIVSSGRHTHIDGKIHQRVPFGCYKVGRVAEGLDAKFLTNDVTNDPRIHDSDWARSLGLVSFAGYRLLSAEGDPIGVLALFSKNIISPNDDAMLEGLANTTTQVIQAFETMEVLKETEQRFKELADSLPQVVFETDEKGNITFVNRNSFDLFGYAEEDLDSSLNIFQMIALRDRERAKEHMLGILKGEKFDDNEYTAIKRDGSAFPVAVHSAPVIRENRPVGLRGLIIDLTSEKEREEEKKRLEAQFHQAQKMEAIGTLAGGIAHDFNNLLMGIQGCASLAMTDMDPSHAIFEHLKGIEEYVKGAVDLTKQLLGFARGGKYEVEPADMNELIKKSSEMFGRTKKEIAIHPKYQKNIWVVEADKGQIEQVLLNLYVNAWQAMPGGGELYLQTENVILQENHTKPYDVKPGKYVKISVTDTGTGMDRVTQERIFDPFFTTKEMGRGTGLGLASVYGIVKNHGGFINVFSEEGQGTTFKIYLPVSELEVRDLKLDASEGVKRGDETILLVDDETMVLNVGSRMMERFGHEVMKASSGKEALKIYKKNRDEIDLVILDMIMPGMSGGETYDRLKAINPDIKVLLASGYSIDGQAQEILDRGCNGFIQKPFDMKQLSRKIRKVLNR